MTRVAEYASLAQLLRRNASPLDERETAQPLIDRFRNVENRAGRTIVALQADTGRLLAQVGRGGRGAADVEPVCRRRASLLSKRQRNHLPRSTQRSTTVVDDVGHLA